MRCKTTNITRWKLITRLANYFERNKKLSPIYQKEYSFLKHLYWYLINQENSIEFKKHLYKEYIDLINIGYFPNKEDISIKMVELIFLQFEIILDREYQGPWTFINLNNSMHYENFGLVINLIHNWCINPNYYGYASENEFFEDLVFLRKQFMRNKIDFYEAVGKWPKKFRKRFSRKD